MELQTVIEYLMNNISSQTQKSKKNAFWAGPGIERAHDGRLKFLRANFHTEWSMIAKHDN
jgi:hypothetical protein